MTTIYIGSSNVERFADIIEKETRNSLVVHKCTHLNGFVARMESLKETDRRIIISVIENFLCDEVNGSVTKGDIEKAIEKTLTAFTKVVGETAARLPMTKFAIIEPIERPAIGWFTSGLKDITMEYSKLINGLSLTNVMIIKKVDLPAQAFDEQKIHLTPPDPSLARNLSKQQSSTPGTFSRRWWLISLVVKYRWMWQVMQTIN